MEYRELPIGDVHTSSINPRKTFDKGLLAELAASIQEKGIIEPLVVRSVNGHVEVVAGERRLRGAQLAGLTTVPTVTRDLTDVQALEVSIIENLQRADVHPLEEADGYRRLLKADGAYTIDGIAVKVGKSKSYVYQRLKLTELTKPVQAAFRADRITAGHAILLARLTPKDQVDALEECFHTLYGADPDGVISVRELDRWITNNVRIDLQADTTRELFPKVAEAVEKAASAGETLLELSADWAYGQEAKRKKGQPPPPISRNGWHEIKKKKDRCPSTTRGVIVLGETARVLNVCATKGCTKHFPPARTYKESAADRKWREQRQARQAREQRQARAWKMALPEVYAAVSAKAERITFTPALIALLLEELKPWNPGADFRKHVSRKVTAKTLPAQLALHLLQRHHHAYEAGRARRIAAAVGIDVKAIERKHQPKAKKKAKKTNRAAVSKKATKRVQTSARRRAGKGKK